jgi:hypothetical protein
MAHGIAPEVEGLLTSLLMVVGKRRVPLLNGGLKTRISYWMWGEEKVWRRSSLMAPLRWIEVTMRKSSLRASAGVNFG